MQMRNKWRRQAWKQCLEWLDDTILFSWLLLFNIIFYNYYITKKWIHVLISKSSYNKNSNFAKPPLESFDFRRTTHQKSRLKSWSTKPHITRCAKKFLVCLIHHIIHAHTDARQKCNALAYTATSSWLCKWVRCKTRESLACAYTRTSETIILP